MRVAHVRPSVLDVLPHWLSFLYARDVVAFAAVSKLHRRLLEDAHLLVDAASDASRTSSDGADRAVELRAVSREPLICVCDDFLTADECRALVSLGRLAKAFRCGARRLRDKHYVSTKAGWIPPRARRLLQRLDKRCAAVCGAPPDADDGAGSDGGCAGSARGGEALELHFTPATHDRACAPTHPAEAGSSLDRAVWWLSEAGVHVDVNNGFPRRYATALIYLNDVAPLDGGGTVFPAAGARQGDAILATASSLLNAGVHHTDSAIRQDDDERLFDDGCDMLAAASRLCLDDVSDRLRGGTASGALGVGLRVQPRAGSLCLFWSLKDDGAVDERSWHGGARLLRPSQAGDAGKWTLQSFRRLPSNVSGRAGFVSESRRQLASSGGGVRITVRASACIVK
ncbi:hypothetical protein M885DRAFT_512450 [Pelagophyceae sp. CCMP2097]|nr:hypothetical protein M885DRAFT_512450 [Pelagophyceae sp. CCMP2097]